MREYVQKKLIETLGVKVIGPLGSGRYCSTYLVKENERLQVAKVPNPYQTEKIEPDEGGRYLSVGNKQAHILEEFDRLGRLSHINVVPNPIRLYYERNKLKSLLFSFIPVEEANATREVVLFKEYIEGETLNDNNCNTQVQQRLEETLREIHRCGVTHIDFHRDNIIVSPSGVPYIIDFGNTHTWDLESRRTKYFSKHQKLDFEMLEKKLSF